MKVILVVAGVLVLAAIAAIAYFAVEVDRRADENAALAARNVTLAQKNVTLTRNLDALGRYNAAVFAEAQAAAEARNEAIVRGNALRAEHDTLAASHAALTAEHDILTVSHAALTAEHDILTVSHAALTAEHGTLTASHAALTTEHRALVDRGVTVADLEAQIAALEVEIAPLLAAAGSRYAGRVSCTGSMEPTITCLDESVKVRPDKPERIVVGTMISFSPGCGDDTNIPNNPGRLHRVIDVKVEDGVHYYWPKGDASERPDGCWVPYEDVDSYIVEIRKNVYPENAFLRDQVQVHAAAASPSWDDYLGVVVELRAALGRYCVLVSDWGYDLETRDCAFDESAYTIVNAIWDRYLAFRDRYEQVWEPWFCWVGVASLSEYPGHVPENDCPVLAVN